MVQLAAIIIVIIGFMLLWPFILGIALVLIGLFLMYWKFIVGAIALAIVAGVVTALMDPVGDGNTPPRNTTESDLDEFPTKQEAQAVAEQEKLSRDIVREVARLHYSHFPEHLDRLPSLGKNELDDYIDDVLSPFSEKWKTLSSRKYGYRESYQGEFLTVFLEALPTHEIGKIEKQQLQRAVITGLLH